MCRERPDVLYNPKYRLCLVGGRGVGDEAKGREQAGAEEEGPESHYQETKNQAIDRDCDHNLLSTEHPSHTRHSLRYDHEIKHDSRIRRVFKRGEKK